MLFQHHLIFSFFFSSFFCHLCLISSFMLDLFSVHETIIKSNLSFSTFALLNANSTSVFQFQANICANMGCACVCVSVSVTEAA